MKTSCFLFAFFMVVNLTNAQQNREKSKPLTTVLSLTSQPNNVSLTLTKSNYTHKQINHNGATPTPSKLSFHSNSNVEVFIVNKNISNRLGLVNNHNGVVPKTKTNISKLSLTPVKADVKFIINE